MSNKTMWDDPDLAQLYFNMITLAVFDNDFDLDKAAKQLKASKLPIGRNMARIHDALARWETHIANVERTTHNPEARMMMRKLLAGIRGTRQAKPI